MLEKKKKRSKGRSFFKKMLGKIVVRSVNKINFVNFAAQMAHSKPGQPFLDKFKKMPKDWEHTKDISRLAVDLTLAQIEQEGESVDRKEIEQLVNEIEIRYNREIHENVTATFGLMFDHLFEHQNSILPFTSPDGRDIKHLKKLKEYRKQGLGVIFLINHSSHLDEFLVDLLWQNLYMGLPVFAAGQNMMAIKSVENLLMTGSYLVLREGANRYQMAVLYNYCKALSCAGAQQGIFLEAWRGGARTRDGSLRYPKSLVTLRGAMDVMVDENIVAKMDMDDNIEDKLKNDFTKKLQFSVKNDVVIQPIALSYSAVPEDLMMCSRKSSKSWVRGMKFFKALLKFPLYPKAIIWRAAENLYGRAYISVPPPMLLSEIKKNHQNDKTGIALDEFVALSSIREIARCKKVMAGQLTARGIVYAKRKGIELYAAVKTEMETIRQYHINTFGEEPDFEDFIRNNSLEDVIEDGLKILKKRGVLSRILKDETGIPEIKDEVALGYYATHGDRRLYSPTADQNIVVVGAGNWGFAIASHVGNRLLEDKRYNNASITIFDSRLEVARYMGINRTGSGRFSEKILPKNVFVTNDLPSAFRKASEIIMASKPEDFEMHIRGILENSEQPFKIMVATRGFIPERHSLPYHATQEMLQEYGRRDVDVFTLAGPVDPDDLVETKNISGVLAGAKSGLAILSDLFQRSSGNTFLSYDPIGVQVADIMARVYAVWINFMDSSKRINHASQLGFLVSAISEEVKNFAVALGAMPDTFTGGSKAWTVTMTSVSLSGI
ncbi:MAG: hypothetical protein B6I31_04065 [Desulfobacteraceae bacterium 4572_19]|nr:MAG: hypothetical protein B6I31_04065 [Desulfobacteraceae bacterium 4572_19]